jgi:hypothetical protein
MAKRISKKEIERRINRAVVGLLIPVLDIGRVWKFAEKAIAEGDDDDVLKAKVARFVNGSAT